MNSGLIHFLNILYMIGYYGFFLSKGKAPIFYPFQNIDL